MFVSPTEPAALREIGITTPLPEEYGVDIMWTSQLGTIGIQRKQFPGDFLSSMSDGRLTKEYQQMKGLDIAILLLEGRQNWTTDGELYGAYGNNKRSFTWSRQQHRHYLTSVQMRGIQVQTSDSIADTIDFVRGLFVWADKGDHSSLDRRPAAKSELYGTVSNEDYVKWLYQSFPTVGPKAAAAIYRDLGVILRLTVGEEELARVKGLGKARAKKIVGVFSGARATP